MDRSQRYEASRGDEGRYRLLIEAIVDCAIFMLDAQGRIMSWNPGAARIKGYDEAEILGRHFSAFYTEEDRAAGAPDRALRAARETGRYESEGWRVRKNGAPFWAHVLIDPIRSPSGDLLGYAKVTRDLTERKAAQEALQKSEEQFRRLVEGVTDYAIFMLDRDGRVTSWNAGAERIHGYRPDEIIGEHFGRFYTEEDRRAGEPAVALSAAETEGRYEKEGPRVRKDGETFWAHVVIDPIRDDKGVVIGFAKITRDISDRHEAQQQLDQARQALMQAQKMDAIGLLTGGVAHDFNNLLMAILGGLELLRKRLPPDPKSLALLENAVQGAQRGAALTQRMLAFARKQELTLEAVEIPTLVRGMTGLLERTIGPGVQVSTRFARGLGPAYTDANQLETALLNLAVNARDAMPEGGRITIEASAECLGPHSDLGLPEGEYVRLSVIDEGAGMDEQTLARATEPFYTTKGVGKGTGLGLPMVHGLAEQSGGRLVLHSRPGAGTRVDIWLPRAGVVGRWKPPPDPVARDPAAASSVRPLVVLAVDDDALVLVNTAAMLEDLGHRVIAVSSASEALAALADHSVDVVITDHAMPHMTGMQLAEEIRARRPDLPVVLATGYAELPPGGEVKAMPRLAKPYGQSDLERLLRDVAARELHSA